MKTKKARAKNSQHEQFIDKARELGCDEDETAFDAKLKAVAGQKPKPKKDKSPAK